MLLSFSRLTLKWKIAVPRVSLYGAIVRVGTLNDRRRHLLNFNTFGDIKVYIYNNVTSMKSHTLACIYVSKLSSRIYIRTNSRPQGK